MSYSPWGHKELDTTVRPCMPVFDNLLPLDSVELSQLSLIAVALTSSHKAFFPPIFNKCLLQFFFYYIKICEGCNRTINTVLILQSLLYVKQK